MDNSAVDFINEKTNGFKPVTGIIFSQAVPVSFTLYSSSQVVQVLLIGEYSLQCSIV